MTLMFIAHRDFVYVTESASESKYFPFLSGFPNLHMNTETSSIPWKKLPPNPWQEDVVANGVYFLWWCY